MRRVRRLLALAVALLALTGAGTSSADHLDPEKRIRPADQARARAMLVRAGDLGAGYRVERTSGLEPHLTCRSLDESDLTLTGEARTPFWARELRIVSSAAAVYRSRGDADAAWARGTSAPGLRCLRDAFGAGVAQGGPVRARLRKLAFPRVAERTAAYRLTLTGTGGGTPQLFVDFVLLQQGRAQAVLVFASVVLSPERRLEVALARRVGARMSAAMRRG